VAAIAGALRRNILKTLDITATQTDDERVKVIA
jgi:hypothetical protein